MVFDKARSVVRRAKPALDVAKVGVGIAGKGALIGLKVGKQSCKTGFWLFRFLKGPWVVCWAAGFILHREKATAAAEKKWNIDFSDLEEIAPKDLQELSSQIPRWVMDGDWDRATWLNTAIEQMWPSINEVRFTLRGACSAYGSVTSGPGLGR